MDNYRTLTLHTSTPFFIPPLTQTKPRRLKKLVSCEHGKTWVTHRFILVIRLQLGYKASGVSFRVVFQALSRNIVTGIHFGASSKRSHVFAQSRRWESLCEAEARVSLKNGNYQVLKNNANALLFLFASIRLCCLWQIT
jgi:hypothetical protein